MERGAEGHYKMKEREGWKSGSDGNEKEGDLCLRRNEEIKARECVMRKKTITEQPNVLF